ncbi:MAG: hypothetical protein HC930_07905 [Hydrococcus sp. SU_1_0]|nr:hypothetical protein [Hydrococcus sp. SU_1_0]
MGNSTTIYGIDITSFSPDYLTVIKTITNSVSGITDFAFHPTNGTLYTIKNSDGTVHEISWPTGANVTATVTSRGVPTGMPTGTTSYGAMFFAKDGSFYGYRNDGQIYRITNVSGTGTPIATLITSSATSVSTNDGARCALAPPIYPPNTVDYGDAPDTADDTGTDNYRTKALDDGPVHEIVTGLRIGTNVDGDSGSLQNTAADADDTTGTPDDEDGVATFPSLYTDAGVSYSVPVQVTNTTGSDAYLVGYIDFNKDGDFEDANEKSTIVSVPHNPTGNQSVAFTTPAEMTVGNTYARFRLSSTSAQAESSVGTATSGEVEDYQIAIALALDYGDAPDTYGTDKIANNSSNTSDPVGANHKITPGLFLGATTPDIDANGFVDGTDNNNNATDDDAAIGSGTGNGSDEGNLTLPTIIAGQPAIQFLKAILPFPTRLLQLLLLLFTLGLILIRTENLTQQNIRVFQLVLALMVATPPLI